MDGKYVRESGTVRRSKASKGRTACIPQPLGAKGQNKAAHEASNNGKQVRCCGARSAEEKRSGSVELWAALYKRTIRHSRRPDCLRHKRELCSQLIKLSLGAPRRSRGRAEPTSDVTASRPPNTRRVGLGDSDRRSAEATSSQLPVFGGLADESMTVRRAQS
ncbi:hypothetical protein PENSPDRAFT_342819 [Peniophora sp. CONT]|nr:hypothetical protein PENSPDRAFT_342819 [Peniophora sp. CONT]